MTTAAAAQPAPVRANPVEFILAVLGFIALIICLPFVLVLGGPFLGWFLGALLYTASWAALLYMTKISAGMDPTHAVGMMGISSIGRAMIVVMALFVIAIKVDKTVGLVAGGVFAVAFTFDLLGRTTLFSIREKQQKAAREEAAE